VLLAAAGSLPGLVDVVVHSDVGYLGDANGVSGGRSVEVVVLSAGPASHIVARHPVALERPRDLLELRTSAAFIDLYRALWAVLREEVIKSQREKSRA